MTTQTRQPLMTTLWALVELGRYHRPVGIFLLIWPTMWGLFAASDSAPDPNLIFLFILGSCVMRGAGCTINDFLDRDVDSFVTRTKGRPLPRGLLTPAQIGTFLFIQLAMGAWILYQLPIVVIKMGWIALAFLAFYPLAKRITIWPQIFLALTYNWSIFMAAGAVQNRFVCKLWPLYVFGVLLTFMYDTIYAHQDKLDDARVGVGSAALALGELTKPVLWGLLGVMGALMIFLAMKSHYSLWFMGWTLAAFMHQAIQLKTVDLDKPSSCHGAFMSNIWFGMYIAIAFLDFRAAF